MIPPVAVRSVSSLARSCVPWRIMAGRSSLHKQYDRSTGNRGPSVHRERQIPLAKNLLHSAGASARFGALDGNRAVMRKRVEVFYTGRVQGVGFRYTTREIAKGFEVSGSVQNLEDGRVELEAEGEETEL